MSQEAEDPEEKSEDYSLEEFDSTLQLGDTELNGVPYDEIIDNYGSDDVDQIVFHGDASKKEGKDVGTVSPDVYFNQLKETYQDLDKLGEELDADVLVLPGNHSPIEGSHGYEEGKDKQHVEYVEKMLEEEYEEFSEYEGNAYEFFIDLHENLTDLTETEYQTEEGNTIIGMSDHFSPEIDTQNYELLKVGEDIEKLGYDREEVADKLYELQDKDGADNSKGKIKSFFDKPKVKWWIQPVGSGPVDAAKEENKEVGDIDPENITRETIENLPEDVKEEIMTSEHQQYLQMVDEHMELSDEEQKAFREEVARLGGRIENADGKVHVVHHSTPYHSDRNQYGSVVLADAIEKHGDKIEVVSGGHTHGGKGEYKLGGVHVLNAAETYSEIGLGEKLHTEINKMDVEEPARKHHEPTPEEEESQYRKVFEEIESLGSLEEFFSRQEDRHRQMLDSAAERGLVPEEEKDQEWEKMKKALEPQREEIREMWESGEYEQYLEEDEESEE